MEMQTLDDIYRKNRSPALPIFFAAAAAAAIVAVLLVRGCGKDEPASGDSAAAATNGAPAQAASAPAAAEAASAAPAAPAAAEPAAALPAPATDAPRVGTLSEAAFKKALADAAEAEKTGKLYDARETLLAALDAAGENYAPALEQVLGRLAGDIYFSQRPGPDKVVYAVRPGDSLAKLADRYVCPVALIMRANGVKDAKRIQPGQTLVFPDHPKFAVTVSKSKNTLLLTLNGKFFKRYVVGTGANAKTPAGTWKMVDREEHPGWWKDGELIPYGDERNILGTHWLALEPVGDTPRVSGYGIHGTWDDSTLGKQSSAGCVRMRNSDVEELFVLLPRGTPVLIVE